MYFYTQSEGEFDAHDYVIFQHNTHRHSEEPRDGGDNVMSVRMAAFAMDFLAEHRGEKLLGRTLRKHLVAKGFRVSEIPKKRRLTNWIQREVSKAKQKEVPKGPSIASLENSVRQWNAFTPAANADELVLCGDTTLTSNDGYVPFSCPRFL